MIVIEFSSLILLIITVGSCSASSYYTPTEYAEELTVQSISYRLPNNTVPRLYTINLEPHIDNEEFTFDGTSSILFEVLDPTNSINVHAGKFIEIDKTYTKLICNDGTILEPIAQRWNSTLEFFNVRFDRVLETGQYTIKYKWRGHEGDYFQGFFRVAYRTTDQHNSEPSLMHMVATHFQATAARAAFPCWDEPAFKAEFEISIKHYKNYTALSNMPVKIAIPVSDGKIRTSFEKSPLMSTYLVNFIVAPYTRHVNAHGNMTFWTQSDRSKHADLIFNLSQKIIPIMEEYTGMHYVLPKMDQAVIPWYPVHATEHWGLISYSTVILYNPETDSIEEKDDAVLLAAHEISHNWFGNLVTPAWWSDVWLSEAFAVYFSHKIADKILDDWHGTDIFATQVVNERSFTADLRDDDPHPIKWMPQTPMEIRKMFGDITYRKGAAIVQMLEHILTEEVFRNGLRKYFHKHQFGSVVTDDLWQALQEAHNEEKILPHLNIKEIMDPWIEQTGYPLLNIERNYRNGFVTVTQTNALSSESNNSWMIPINYATSSQMDFSSTQPTYWMHPKNETLMLSEIDRDDWFILNIQNTGFYRVNYDNENWKRLAEYLNSDDYHNIHVLNRAQLLHDIVYLARKDPNYNELAVDMVSYLHRETNYLPWVAVLSPLAEFNRYLINTPNYDIYEKWMLHLMNNIIDHIGFENNDNDHHLSALARYDLLSLACHFGHAGCRRFATRKLVEELRHKQTKHEEWMHCIGLMSSNETLWDMMMYAHSTNPLTGYGYKYLGCTKNQTLINKYLIRALADNATHLTDPLVDAFDSITTEASGNNEFALDFFIANFDAIQQHFRDRNSGSVNPIEGILRELSRVIKTIHQFQKFEKFMNEKIEEGKITSYGAIQSARNTLAKSERAVGLLNSLLNKKSSFTNFITSE